MADSNSDNRRFRVHARHIDAHHARLIAEPTFEAAAIAYIEDLHVPAGDGDEISIIVRDLDSGHEHCFRLDLHTGETSPCG
jgi:hypothetical protein